MTDDNVNPRVLVTGSSGFIGSRLVRTTRQKSLFVVGVDIRPAPTTNVQLDLSKTECQETLSQVLIKCKITHVVHIAALIRVGEGESKPLEYWNTNVKGTYNVLKSMEKAGVTNIIFASSAAVYDPWHTICLNEKSPVGPISVYGRTKLEAEELIRGWKGIQAVIFRIFNVAGGKEDDPCHLIPLIFQRWTEGKPVQIFGGNYSTEDGSCIRSYIHVRDIIVAIFHALRRCGRFLAEDKCRIYNLGRPKGYSVFEVYRIAYNFCRSVGEEGPAYQVMPPRSGDPPKLTSWNTKARQDLNWEPTYNLKAIIYDTFAEMFPEKMKVLADEWGS